MGSSQSKTANWASKKRPPDDFYESPRWLVHGVIEAEHRPWRSVLDAGAGTGILASHVEEYVRAVEDGREPIITTVEQDPDRIQQHGQQWEAVNDDFLVWAEKQRTIGRRFDLVISNPPFKGWLDWAKACLDLVSSGGQAIILGQAGILSSQGRYQFWTSTTPTHIYQVTKRPSFTPDRATDAREYVWIVWDSVKEVEHGGTTYSWLRPPAAGS